MAYNFHKLSFSDSEAMVKNESKMPKFLHTKCRQASKQAHPPLESPLQYYKNTERKKRKRMTEKTREKKKKN